VAPSEAAIARISPWRFEAALSPDMAAAREGRRVPFDELVAFCHAHLSETGPMVFIEGVGGVLVPLDERHTVRDWIAALGLPVVLVAGSYLGTISHTLTALEALDRCGLDVAALVINESAESTVPLEETLATLMRFGHGVPLVSMRRHTAGPEKQFELLWRALESGTAT
jgi:dethiobiotin synthetase